MGPRDASLVCMVAVLAPQPSLARGVKPADSEIDNEGQRVALVSWLTT
jgi:hypothetical protein